MRFEVELRLKPYKRGFQLILGEVLSAMAKYRH